jgi:hypothetical protein
VDEPLRIDPPQNQDNALPNEIPLPDGQPRFPKFAFGAAVVVLAVSATYLVKKYVFDGEHNKAIP